jgi:hypothetical protein
LKKTTLLTLSLLRGRYRILTLAFLMVFGCASMAFLWHGYTATPVNLLFIQDEAHVLNQERVIQAANGVGYNIDLFTLDGNAGDLVAFSRAHVSTPLVGTVVIVIDTRHKQLVLQGNGSMPNNPVSFTAPQYHAAQKAFQATISKGDFIAATVAVLRELSKAAASNRFLPSLRWLVGFLLDFVVTVLLIGALFFPRRGGRETAVPLSDLRTMPLA